MHDSVNGLIILLHNAIYPKFPIVKNVISAALENNSNLHLMKMSLHAENLNSAVSLSKIKIKQNLEVTVQYSLS